MDTISHTVVGVFDNSSTANMAVEDLVSNGFARDRIRVTSNDRLASDTAWGSAGLSGQQPSDRSGGGIGGFFRRMFGSDDQYSHHYEEAVRRGGSIVSVTTDGADDERAADILDRNGAVDIDQRAESWRKEGYSWDSNRDRLDREGERTIPVVREELEVGKREVQRGGVRVFNRVYEEPVAEQVNLREEHVRVDRRPANRQATEADLRGHDEVIEVIETSEEPVIGKTARVVEDVVVGKETKNRTETVRDTVRRSEVEVEKIGRDDRTFGDYDEDFRSHFSTHYGTVRGATYERHAPAYQYGYRSASDERYLGRNWDEIEPTLRSDYERTYPDSKWEQMKDSVRYGWDKVTRRR